MFGLTGYGADHLILTITGSYQFSAEGEDAGLGAGSPDINAKQIWTLCHESSYLTFIGFPDCYENISLCNGSFQLSALLSSSFRCPGVRSEVHYDFRLSARRPATRKARVMPSGLALP